MPVDHLTLSPRAIKLAHQLKAYKLDSSTTWCDKIQDRTLAIISFISRNTESPVLPRRAISVNSPKRHRRAASLDLEKPLGVRSTSSFPADWLIDCPNLCNQSHSHGFRLAFCLVWLE